MRELKTNGFCKISKPKFYEIANYLNPNDGLHLLKDNEHKCLQGKKISEIESNNAGITNYWLSFKDPIIQKIFFDEEILGLINKYAGGPLYYRQSPILERHSYNGSDLLTKNKKEWANLLHTDYHLQINIMLLLTDINLETTKTIYARGSNNRNFILQKGKIDYPKSEELVVKHGYELTPLLGKKGDLIIMDTGGIHAAEIIKDTNRTMLIGIVNPGFPFKGYHENLDDLKIDCSKYDYVRNALCRNK